ncbi:MAG: hypothetical protein ACI4BH_11965 [Muribaculaceae bacterium]
MIRIKRKSLTLLATLSICLGSAMPCVAQQRYEGYGEPVKGRNEDPTQKSIGSIPYEMKGRKEVREPVLTFDDCSKWQIRTHQTEAALYRTKEQRVVGEYSGKVVYKAAKSKAGIIVELAEPYKFEKDWDCINFWNYGNHWLWENGGEALNHYALIRDAKGRDIKIPFMQDWLWRNMDYKYWFLNHIKLNDSIARPITFVGMEFSGGGNVVDKVNQIYLGPIYGYKEDLKPMTFKPLPEKLPFPLRKETILPTNKVKGYRNSSEQNGDEYLFSYQGGDAKLTYRVDPAQPIGGVTVLYNGQEKKVNVGAEIIFENHTRVNWKLISKKMSNDTLYVSYKASGKGIGQRFDCSYTIKQKSLIWTIEEAAEEGKVEEVRLGATEKVDNGKIIDVPFLVYDPFYKDSYNADQPGILYSDDLFYFTMFDWYYSNASRHYAGDKAITNGHAVYNGGALYNTKNNDKRNPLRERLFINISPDVHEVFPTIDNPASPMRSAQADRLWTISGGSDLNKLGKFVKEMRSKGVENVSIRYHEDFWRAGGESYTFRTETNPEIGEDNLRDYVKMVQGQDWRIGFYSNYMDFAPVNALWNEDWVRISDKDHDYGWGAAWCRCYANKVTIGWEQEALLAPQIHKKFGTNFSYCDVETCISPMTRVDYDYRTPGAGKFRTVFEYIGMTLLNERRAYQGPVYSEGGVHWYYAGLLDGNYSHMNHSLPIFPDFHLLKMHPLEMDAMSNVGGEAYVAYAYAFGNIGILSDGYDALRRYAFLQPFQNSYVMIPVKNIGYYDGKALVDASEAIKKDLIKTPSICVEYASGLTIYANFSENPWNVKENNKEYTLPKHGTLAILPGSRLFSVSAINSASAEGKKLDKVFSDGLYYIDTRGEVESGELGGKGSYMLKKEKFGWEIIPLKDCEEIDFNLSLLDFSDLGVDIEAVDRDGNVIEVINAEPMSHQIHFEHESQYYKYRICPVVTLAKE